MQVKPKFELVVQDSKKAVEEIKVDHAATQTINEYYHNNYEHKKLQNASEDKSKPETKSHVIEGKPLEETKRHKRE